MVVNVTQEDIDLGQHSHCTKCPVALAISRAIKEDLVSVAYSFCLIGADKYQLPEEVSSFITHFDLSESVLPFSFEFQYKV